MDQKHSKNAQSSIPSKSMIDFLTKAQTNVAMKLVRAAKRSSAKAGRTRKGKGSSGGNPKMAPNGVQSVIGTVGSMAPIAAVGKIGIADHTVDVSYVTGGIYIGNGTLGAAHQAYFQDLQNNLWTSAVPVLLRDRDTNPLLVPNYASNVTKYFAEAEVLDASLEFQSRQPSTAINSTVATAAMRGFQSTPHINVSGTPTPVAASTVLSAEGGCRMGGYQNRVISLKNLIAGGKGAEEKKFFTNAFSGSPLTDGQAFQTQGAMASFVVGGTGDAGGTYDGTKTHDVIVRLRLRLRDFVGLLYEAAYFGDEKRSSGDKKTPGEPGWEDAALAAGRPSQRTAASAAATPPVPILSRSTEPSPDSSVKSAGPSGSRPGWFG